MIKFMFLLDNSGCSAENRWQERKNENVETNKIILAI